MRKIVFLLLLLITGVYAMAKDGLTFVAEAPEVVVSGDQFRLTFTVNTQKVKDFRAPSVKGFEVLMGPSRSSQNSTQIINGKVFSSSSITYTYILMAGKEGTYTVPAASIVADGETLISNSLQIKVLPADDSSTAGQGAESGSSRSQAAGSKITDKDLFITATASKTKVYEQEAILLTYKVYTVVDLRQLRGDMPDLKGFHTQEVELPAQKTFTLEHYKGRNYNTTVWWQYVVFPQQSGNLEIPSIPFDAVIAQRINSDDPFDAFFNGGTNYVEIKKRIVTPKLKINVESLPSNKPAGFSGAVGTFTMASSINSKSVKTNDAITIKLTVSGTGNMKLIGTPEVKFPQDFEIYDPKVDNQFNLSREGLTGSKTFEYLAIPRHAGKFTVPAVTFTYFDLKSKSYKTLKSDEYVINVEKGAGDGNASQVIADFSNKEAVKMLGSDVRYIKRGATSFSKYGDYFYGTTTYWMCYLVPLLLFVLFILVYRKQAIDNANTAKMKTKKANKVAVKRMKLAGKLLAENKKNEFYDEVLKALWGYISDKLSIPVSQLSKDNIEQELAGHQVSEELVKAFMDVLNECEFARYAPGDENEAMDKVYTASIEVISKMENSIKR